MGSRRKPSAAVSAAARALSALGASKGGKASAAALTPEERKARARTAIETRWKGHRKTPVDQAAVLARLKAAAGGPSLIDIAPGAGGKRRRAAIERLRAKGVVRVIESGETSVKIISVAACEPPF
jgi:hypothetical protein